MLSMNNNLVCKLFRSLEDVCSLDIDNNPFVPFGGAAVIKCDESKFNHKAKVKRIMRPVSFSPIQAETISFSLIDCKFSGFRKLTDPDGESKKKILTFVIILQITSKFSGK